MSDDEELRKKIQESLAATSSSVHADLGSVERRARRLRTRRVVVGSTAAAVVLSAVAIPLALLSPLGHSTRNLSGAPSGGLGSLDVTRLVEPGGVRYTEGAFAFVLIKSPDGHIVVEKELHNYLSELSFHVELQPGPYLLESYERGCQLACPTLDPLHNEACSARFQIGGGDRLAATIRIQVSQGCAISFGSPSPDVSGSATPDVAQVVCDDSGTHVLTPQVKPQPDGVHFQVENRTDERLNFYALNASGTGGGGWVMPGTSEPTGPPRWLITPGVVSVTCGGQPQGPTPPSAVTLEVVDEDGIWLPTTLSCESVTQTFSSYLGASQGPDPVQLTKDRFTGLLETDIVEEAGYPQAAAPSVVVVRDGEVIALADFFRAVPDGWLIDPVKFCSDSGLNG
jgi:hypothetical protein